MQEGRDIWWDEVIADCADTCDPEPMRPGANALA